MRPVAAQPKRCRFLQRRLSPNQKMSRPPTPTSSQLYRERQFEGVTRCGATRLCLQIVAIPLAFCIFSCCFLANGCRPIQLCGTRDRNRFPGYEEPLRPLPTVRPRNVSHSRPADSQLQSLLIRRLPLDIRLTIWEYALGHEDDMDLLHMELAGGGLRSSRCIRWDPAYSDRKGDKALLCWTPFFEKAENRPWWPTQQLCALLLTCRLMYVATVSHTCLTSTKL